MTKAQLRKKIAYLEFVNDQLSSELEHLDELLIAIGFPQGLKSAKGVAIEMLKEKQNEDS